jgi:hypothetical protein
VSVFRMILISVLLSIYRGDIWASNLVNLVEV